MLHIHIALHYGLKWNPTKSDIISGRMIHDKKGKLRGRRHKGRNSAVQCSKLSWTGQYNKCVQYDFRFTPVYSKNLLFQQFHQNVLA